MKTLFRNLFLALLLAASFSLPAFAASGKYYTKVNIWYEKPDEILTTNYHKGVMIPLGTEVEVIKSSKKKIEFQSGGTVYKIELVKKFADLNEQQLFDRYFSKDNVLKSGEYSSLSSQEKAAVKAGTIEVGMSKPAVLLAYGYPPTHRTPTTEQDTWTYWKSRLGNFLVQFKDGKVISTGKGF